MDYHTTAQWDEALWNEAERVYHQAFPEASRKNRTIIRRMFEKRMCFLHTMTMGTEVIAMALSGINKKAQVLILDYLAVKENLRRNGWGKLFVGYIKTWAETMAHCNGIVIEIEAEATPENTRRIGFWEQCGFRLTEYVHHYIWVPEPYRAMYLKFNHDFRIPDNGQILFRYITQFHKQAYSKNGG